MSCLLETSRNMLAWYCLKTQSKRERIAAENIRNRLSLDIFSPRIRYIKRTRQGKRQHTEAVFPGYVFVQCVFEQSFRALRYAEGISDFVHFGNYYPTISAHVLEAMKTQMKEGLYEVCEPELKRGAEVVVLEGPFSDFIAEVVSTSSKQRRVSLLLSLLGQEVQVSVPCQAIMLKKHNPKSFMMAV